MITNSNLPKITRELKFVLNCTKPEADKVILNTLTSSSMDWDQVLHLALIHGLFPLVYKTLRSLNYSIVPEYVIKVLKQHSFKNAIKVSSLTDEIVRINKSMEESGVQCIILKGSPLSVKINEDIILRPSNDIDILVDPLEFVKAEKILEQIGYERYLPDFPMSLRQQKAYFNSHHHFEYFHHKRFINVELHWKIRSFNVKYFPNLSNLNIQKIKIEECFVSVMDNEYWLMFLMIHGYKHLWSRLRWLYDINEFIKENIINWDKIILLADNSELRPVLHQTLILLNELFDVPIPNKLKQFVANDLIAQKLTITVFNHFVNSGDTDNLPNSNLKNIDYFYFNSKWTGGLKFILTKIKPGEKEFKLVSLPDTAYPFYYIIKPFYWLWRRIIPMAK